MFIKLFLFILLHIMTSVYCKIDIRDANVAALNRDEIGMVFYVTVENSNLCQYEVKVGMIECTEILSDYDRDSNFMFLIGGHMGLIKPNCFKNLTIIYPNMYLHNRRGFCLVSIKFRSQMDDIIQRKANITFDTYLSKKSSPTVLRGYFNKAELSKCDSIDQDPLSHCKPVDCHMKYLGTRNFFSRIRQRCQKVPLCILDPKKDMPNMIYSPSTNKCRNMERSVTKEDLQTIEAGKAQKAEELLYFSSENINCHFGKYNNHTGSCECRPGWTSAPIEKDRTPASSLFVYHMCNIESTDWYDTDSRKLKLICLVVAILAVLLAMFIILFAFLIELCYNCIKSFENMTENTTISKKSPKKVATKDSHSNTDQQKKEKKTKRKSKKIKPIKSSRFRSQTSASRGHHSDTSRHTSNRSSRSSSPRNKH